MALSPSLTTTTSRSRWPPYSNLAIGIIIGYCLAVMTLTTISNTNNGTSNSITGAAGIVTKNSFSRILTSSDEEGLSLEEKGVDHDEEGGEHEEEEEEEELDPVTLDTTVAAIIVVLIALTITFEVLKEHIEESADRNLRPIIESLFGELTVLGFLSIVTFLVTKLGYIKTWSEHLFGPLEEELLLETFEFVHYMLFFVMVFFVLLVLFLVHDAKVTETLWWNYDRACRDFGYMTSVREQQQQQIATTSDTNNFGNDSSGGLARHFMTRLFPCCYQSKTQKQTELLSELVLFDAIRTDFILERCSTGPFEPAAETNRVGTDFNFGRYLSICLGHTLAHSVHLNNVTWGFLGVVTIVFYGVLLWVENEAVDFAWAWTAAGWIYLFFSIYFDYHVLLIRKSFLVPSSQTEESGLVPDESQALSPVWATLPAWCRVNVSQYTSDSRSWLARYYNTVEPTAQDTFYWLERKGPKLYSILFQIQLLFCSAYCSLLLVLHLPHMWAEVERRGMGYFVLYFIVSVIPIVLRLANTGASAANVSQVSCVGVHRKPQGVAQVIREEKTDRVIRALIMLQKLQHAAENGFSTMSSSTSASAPVDPVEVAEVSKTFDAFDHSGDGKISTSEFEGIMLQLGAPMTSESLDAMIKVLDADQNGHVSKEEFLSFFAAHVLPAEDDGDDDEGSHASHKRMKERAHFMFSLFDQDNSGEITIGEFKTVIDAFHVGFSVDEVGDLVNELDEHNKGTLGEEEFMEFLEKHSYLFKKRRLPSLA